MSSKQGEWWGFVRGCSLGDEPLTWMRCHTCLLSQLYEGQAYNLKGKMSGFSSFSLALFLFYYSSFHGMMHADPFDIKTFFLKQSFTVSIYLPQQTY